MENLSGSPHIFFSLTPDICFRFSSYSFEVVKSVNSSFSSYFAISLVFLWKKGPVRIHVCTCAFSASLVQKFIDYMILSMATVFVASFEKLVVPSQVFTVFQDI